MMLLHLLAISTVVLVFGYFVLRTVADLNRGTRVIQARNDRESVRQFITQYLNCTATLSPPNVCNGDVPLRKEDGSIFLNPQGSVGAWSITARCEPLISPTHLKMIAVQNGLQDPVTGLFFDENHPRAQLFQTSESAACASFFGAGGGCADCNIVNQNMVGFLPNGCPKCLDNNDLSIPIVPIICTRSVWPATSIDSHQVFDFVAADCIGGVTPSGSYQGVMASNRVLCRSEAWQPGPTSPDWTTWTVNWWCRSSAGAGAVNIQMVFLRMF